MQFDLLIDLLEVSRGGKLYESELQKTMEITRRQRDEQR